MSPRGGFKLWTILGSVPVERPSFLRWLAMVGGSLALAACQKPQDLPTPPPVSVRTEAVRNAAFAEAIETVSTLEAEDEVQLATQASGRIQKLLVRQGDRVQQGQLLLVLDQTQAQADVARLRYETETKRLNYQRYEDLVRQGAASAIQRDQFRQDYLSTRMELIARSADLGFRDLKAPIGGLVGDLQVKEGDVIAAGTPFTKILRNDPIVARVDVPAVVAGRLRVGQTVILMDPSTLRPMARSSVRSLDPAVVAGSQSLLAKAPFSNASGALRHGQRTRTRLILNARTQPSVPFEAVTQVSGQRFVYRVGRQGDQPSGTEVALQTPVELGPLQNNRYPVLRGLQAGQLVITSNLINLRHGLPIKVTRGGDG